MTAAANRALAQPNDTARLLCLMHEINEGAHAALDAPDTESSHSIVDAGLCLAAQPDDEHAREALLYIAAQAVAWLLIIERRKAAA